MAEVEKERLTMAGNRIGSSCWYQNRRYSGGQWVTDPWKAGTLLSWSTDHEEYQDGPGPFPVGVVEDTESNQVLSIHATSIMFSDKAPVDV